MLLLPCRNLDEVAAFHMGPSSTPGSQLRPWTAEREAPGYGEGAAAAATMLQAQQLAEWLLSEATTAAFAAVTEAAAAAAAVAARCGTGASENASGPAVSARLPSEPASRAAPLPLASLVSRAASLATGVAAPLGGMRSPGVAPLALGAAAPRSPILSAAGIPRVPATGVLQPQLLFVASGASGQVASLARLPPAACHVLLELEAAMACSGAPVDCASSPASPFVEGSTPQGPGNSLGPSAGSKGSGAADWTWTPGASAQTALACPALLPLGGQPQRQYRGMVRRNQLTRFFAPEDR